MNSIAIWYNENMRYKMHSMQYTVHNIKRLKHIVVRNACISTKF